MPEAGNPLGIKMLNTGPDGPNGEPTDEAWIRLSLLSEEEVERLRAENLEINDGKQSGEAPPGIKQDEAENKAKELAAEALANPVGGDGNEGPPQSPADALG